MTISLATIYRYPVKGLSAQELDCAHVETGKPLAWDRAFAIENGATDFDPNAPSHLSKAYFLMLMKQPELARLRTEFDDQTGDFSIRLDEELQASGNLLAEGQQQQLLDFLASYCEKPPRGTLRILFSKGHAFTDSRTQDISLINLASVEDISGHAGDALDPIRFRGNLYISGADAWQEHDWVGKDIQIGDVKFHVRKRTVRCAATNANPDTGERDQQIPNLLMRVYDHADCGIHLMPLTSGQVRPGDKLTIL